MQVYLINLDDAKDRLASADAMLEQAGLSYVRAAAVDGRGKPVEHFPAYNAARARRFYGRPLTSGEIGCYLSHLQCVEAFLATDAEYCLVLEDDMSMPPDGAATIAAVVAALKARPDLKWDVINLGKAAKHLTTDIAQTGAYRLQHAHYFPTTTTALLWSRQGAAAFWATRDAIYAPVDHFLRRFCCLDHVGLALTPALIVPTGAESMIDAEGSGDPQAAMTKARKRQNRNAVYYWKEFARQAVNYFGALRGWARTRLNLR